MAENKPTDAESAMPVDDLDSGQRSPPSSDPELSSFIPADGSVKDTLETPRLQAEVESSEENPRDFGADSPAPEQTTAGMSQEDRLIHDLTDAKAALNELMAWKEDLRFLTIHHTTLGAYYDNWTKEANLFFRRVVILNKRLDSYRKKKRA